MDAATLVNSSLDLDTVLQRILTLAMRITDAEASAILLVSEGSDELTFLSNVGGGDARKLAEMKVPIDRSLAGWVIRHGEPLRIDDATKDERFFKLADERSNFRTRSVLAVPLRERGRITGAVQVLNKSKGRPFDDDDERMLSTMADQAGTAVDNSRTYARLLEEKMTLETIVDSLADAILVTDASGALRQTNAAARRLFALDGPTPRHDLLEVLLGSVTRHTHGLAADMVLLKPHGKMLSTRVTPIEGPDGVARGKVAALRDMTHAREGQRRRDEFYAVGVHELDAAVESLGRRLGSSGLDALLAADIGRLRGTLDNLLRFSELEAGPIRLLRRKLGLGELLAATLHGRTRVAANPAPPAAALDRVRLYIDAGQMKQALSLILDACEQLAGGVVTLETVSDGRFHRVDLAGTGDPDRLALAGDRLDARLLVEQFLSTAGTPIDLGLAYARHLLESHGGRLDFEFEASRFCFAVRLPIDCSGSKGGGS